MTDKPADNTQAAVEQFAADRGLTIEAKVMPTGHPAYMPDAFNWKVTMRTANGAEFHTPYFCGGLFIQPRQKPGFSINGVSRADVMKAQRRGPDGILWDFTHKTFRGHGRTTIYEAEVYALAFEPRPPELIDILPCLVRDIGVLDFGSFEDWALDFGYDTDSREAERIYKASLDIALRFRAFLGADGVQELAEILGNY